MHFASYLAPVNSSCLFELSGNGQILYSCLRRNGTVVNEISEVVGQNFFEEIDEFENMRDFRIKVDKFIDSREFADNFLFECRYAENVIPLRVMLLRTFENNNFSVERGIILDIRNNIR